MNEKINEILVSPNSRKWALTKWIFFLVFLTGLIACVSMAYSQIIHKMDVSWAGYFGGLTSMIVGVAGVFTVGDNNDKKLIVKKELGEKE